jgi:hypothetical protein
MCDLNKIAGFILAAQIAMFIALGALFVAMVGNNNITAIFSSTPSMIVAGIVLLSALIFLGIALSSVGPCISPPCSTLANALLGLLFGLWVAVGAMLSAVFLATLGSAIPWAGSGAIAVLFWSLTTQVALWPSVAAALFALSNCRTAPGILPTAVAVLAVFLAFALIVVIGNLGGLTPGGVISCAIFLRC